MTAHIDDEEVEQDPCLHLRRDRLRKLEKHRFYFAILFAVTLFLLLISIASKEHEISTYDNICTDANWLHDNQWDNRVFAETD